MSDAVEAVGAGSQSLDAGITYRLEQLTQKSQVEEVQGANFSKLAKSALSKALESPHKEDPLADARAGLVGPSSGKVGDEKANVLSEVARPGVEANTVDKGEEKLEAVVDRTNKLYSELTVHHIAWGVATRMQRDISQLLRGS